MQNENNNKMHHITEMNGHDVRSLAGYQSVYPRVQTVQTVSPLLSFSLQLSLADRACIILMNDA